MMTPKQAQTLIADWQTQLHDAHMPSATVRSHVSRLTPWLQFCRHDKVSLVSNHSPDTVRRFCDQLWGSVGSKTANYLTAPYLFYEWLSQHHVQAAAEMGGNPFHEDVISQYRVLDRKKWAFPAEDASYILGLRNFASRRIGRLVSDRQFQLWVTLLTSGVGTSEIFSLVAADISSLSGQWFCVLGYGRIHINDNAQVLEVWRSSAATTDRIVPDVDLIAFSEALSPVIEQLSSARCAVHREEERQPNAARRVG